MSLPTAEEGRDTSFAKGGYIGGSYGGGSSTRGQAAIPGWAIALIVLFGFMLIIFAVMFYYFLRNERVRREFNLKPRYHVAAGRAAMCAVGVKPLQVLLNRLGWRHDHCGGLCGAQCMREKLSRARDDEVIAANGARRKAEKEKLVRGSLSSDGGGLVR